MEHIAPVSTGLEESTILPKPILPEMMSVSTVANLLRVDRKSVLEWIKKGKLAATRENDGGPWMIAKSEVAAIVNS